MKDSEKQSLRNALIGIIEANVEPTRKDALLEWAREKQYESLTIAADDFWQEVIDKLNKM